LLAPFLHYPKVITVAHVAQRFAVGFKSYSLIYATPDVSANNPVDTRLLYQQAHLSVWLRRCIRKQPLLFPFVIIERLFAREQTLAISDTPQNTDLSHIPYSHLPVDKKEVNYMGSTLVTKVV
jgi:hypothetical protein